MKLICTGEVTFDRSHLGIGILGIGSHLILEDYALFYLQVYDCFEISKTRLFVLNRF